MANNSQRPGGRVLTPLRVDLQHNDWDKKVDRMIREGFTYGTVSAHTGLTLGQVQYRAHQLGISPLDYRHGKGAVAKEVLQELDRTLGTLAEMKRKIDAVRRQTRRGRTG